eukprot:TRINITY_DN2084_c0_g1_i1.p1 TRINITY_DN2084_c0_g1~~TRINITY_DN2084_c0_g1_i1.p1  ORF type:complete len:473 (+),score=90.42 TRINITY_DN2084_c0_g1_i1:287-1705(+)
MNTWEFIRGREWKQRYGNRDSSSIPIIIAENDQVLVSVIEGSSTKLIPECDAMELLLNPNEFEISSSSPSVPISQLPTTPPILQPSRFAEHLLQKGIQMDPSLLQFDQFVRKNANKLPANVQKELMGTWNLIVENHTEIVSNAPTGNLLTNNNSNITPKQLLLSFKKSTQQLRTSNLTELDMADSTRIDNGFYREPTTMFNHDSSDSQYTRSEIQSLDSGSTQVGNKNSHIINDNCDMENDMLKMASLLTPDIMDSTDKFSKNSNFMNHNNNFDSRFYNEDARSVASLSSVESFNDSNSESTESPIPSINSNLKKNPLSLQTQNMVNIAQSTVTPSMQAIASSGSLSNQSHASINQPPLKRNKSTRDPQQYQYPNNSFGQRSQKPQNRLFSSLATTTTNFAEQFQLPPSKFENQGPIQPIKVQPSFEIVEEPSVQKAKDRNCKEIKLQPQNITYASFSGDSMSGPIKPIQVY